MKKSPGTKLLLLEYFLQYTVVHFHAYYNQYKLENNMTTTQQQEQEQLICCIWLNKKSNKENGVYGHDGGYSTLVQEMRSIIKERHCTVVVQPQAAHL